MATRRDFLKQGLAASLATATLRTVSGAEEAPRKKGRPRHGIVETVLGPLDASKLGFTLSHEHIADAPDVLKRWPKASDARAELVAKAVDHLKVLKAAGISTIVDLTPYDDGRDIRFLREVSRKSGMNMIACTGQSFYPPRSTHISMPAGTVAGLAEFFTREVTLGIDGTNTKAGVIKIRIMTNPPTALEEIGLRAAVRASKATGVPIRIHTDAAHRAGESIAVIIEDEGVDPARVSFDHSDDSGDMTYFLGLVKRGYSLSMDHVHRGISPNALPTFERRVECIKLLIDAGFANKIFLSTDSEFGGSLLPEAVRDWRENLDPQEGMLFSIRKLIPRLRELGLSDQQIRVITVDNPQTFFTKT